MSAATVTGAELGALVDALTDTEVDLCADMAEAWGAAFPHTRFTRRAGGGVLLECTPTEAVELAKRAYILGALSQRPGGAS